MTEELKQKLRVLAQKYEVTSFTEKDPSQFLTRYSDTKNTEVAAFIASLLAFGNRKQFIPKINYILALADEASGDIASWLKTRAFRKTFISPSGDRLDKFYRFYSYKDMTDLFESLATVLSESSLGEKVRSEWNKSGDHPAQILGRMFENCAIVPKGKSSANKRLHMFLRWMVRTDSPVDLGLWTWFDQKDLIIPLDTHVLQQSVELGLISSGKTGLLPPANIKTALKITEALKQVWPTDPCKGDFALFGLGVDE